MGVGVGLSGCRQSGRSAQCFECYAESMECRRLGAPLIICSSVRCLRRGFILSVAEAEEAERRKAEAQAAEAAGHRVRQRRPSAQCGGAGGGSARRRHAGREADEEGGRVGSGDGGDDAVVTAAGPARLQSAASFLDSLGKEERRIIQALSRKYADPGLDEEAGGRGRWRRQRRQRGSNRSRGRGSGADGRAVVQQAPPHMAALLRADAASAGHAAAAPPPPASPPLPARLRSRSAPPGRGVGEELQSRTSQGGCRGRERGRRGLSRGRQDAAREEGLVLLAPQFSRGEAAP